MDERILLSELREEGFSVSAAQVGTFGAIGATTPEQARAAALRFGMGRTARQVFAELFSPTDAPASPEPNRPGHSLRVSHLPDGGRRSCECLGEACHCSTEGPPRRQHEVHDDAAYEDRLRRWAELDRMAAGTVPWAGLDRMATGKSSERGDGVSAVQFSERREVRGFMKEVEARMAEGRRAGARVTFSEAALEISKERPELLHDYQIARDRAAMTEVGR